MCGHEAKDGVHAGRACRIPEVEAGIFGDRIKTTQRQWRAPGIADEYFDARCQAAIEECDDTAGEVGVVEEIAGENEIGGRRIAGENVRADGRDGDVVCGGVELGCGDCVRIDVDRGDAARAGFGGSDGDKTRAAAEIDDAAPRDNSGAIEHMAREREAAAPILRPVRRAEIFVRLRQTPEAAARACLMRPDFRYGGNRRERQVRFNKGGGFGRDRRRSKLALILSAARAAVAEKSLIRRRALWRARGAC